MSGRCRKDDAAGPTGSQAGDIPACGLRQHSQDNDMTWCLTCLTSLTSFRTRTSAANTTESLTRKPASWSNNVCNCRNSRQPQSFADLLYRF